MRELLAVVLAAVASASYALSTSLQALEARVAPADEGLRATLLVRLARRRVWLAGAAAGLAAWGLQAGALALASLALVQPALGLGLVVLLVLGARLLGESIGVREVTAAAAIAVAIGVLAWAAPRESGAFTRTGVVLAIVALAVSVAAPSLLRLLRRGGGLATSLCAGFGWACVGVGTALVDGALADGRYAVAVLWALAVAGASVATLVSEMTALQAWPATRAVPIAFGLEMALPAAAAPLLTAHEPRHAVPFALALALATAGAVALGRSRAVASLN